MVDKSELTFFSPYIILGSGSEHAMRMRDVAINAQDETGTPYFNYIASGIDEDDKVKAIRAFREILSEIASSDMPQKSKADILWQFFLAMNRFHYFAVQDTQRVTDEMFPFITDLFTQAAAIEDDEELFAERRNLISALHYSGNRRNYEEHYAEHADIPVARSQALIKVIKEIDPQAARMVPGLD